MIYTERGGPLWTDLNLGCGVSVSVYHASWSHKYPPGRPSINPIRSGPTTSFRKRPGFPLSGPRKPQNHTQPFSARLGKASTAPSNMSHRRLVSSASPFEAKIGYSRAVVSGEFIFVSGCTGYGPLSWLPSRFRTN